MDANTAYLNEHLNKEAEQDRQAEAAEQDEVNIYLQLVEDLKIDSSSVAQKELNLATPGWNMMSAIDDMPSKYWLPLAEAFANVDKAEIGRIVHEAVTGQLIKEAKYIAQTRLDEGKYK